LGFGLRPSKAGPKGLGFGLRGPAGAKVWLGPRLGKGWALLSKAGPKLVAGLRPKPRAWALGWGQSWGQGLGLWGYAKAGPKSLGFGLGPS